MRPEKFIGISAIELPTEECGLCRKPMSQTPDIVVVVLFAPGLSAPYPLIPEDGYSVCARASCDGAWRFIDRAQAAHPLTRDAGTWTRAIVVVATGQGIDLKNECRPSGFGQTIMGVA